MSEREKKLLIFLGGTLFIILNLIGFNKFYLPKVQEAQSEASTAETELRIAEDTLKLSAIYEPEIVWLENSGTAATDHRTAQSQLQQSLRQQAQNQSLEITSQIIPFQPGTHFDRVKVLCKVSGAERNVISWLEKIHLIRQRQVITKLEMEPKSGDLTRLSVEVEVEKWIIPLEEI